MQHTQAITAMRTEWRNTGDLSVSCCLKICHAVLKLLLSNAWMPVCSVEVVRSRTSGLPSWANCWLMRERLSSRRCTLYGDAPLPVSCAA